MTACGSLGLAAQDGCGSVSLNIGKFWVTETSLEFSRRLLNIIFLDQFVGICKLYVGLREPFFISYTVEELISI